MTDGGLAPPRAGRLILLAPIDPTPTGNGLAMRAELFRRSAPPSWAIETVVVPVAGRNPAPPDPDVALVAVDGARARAGVPALVAVPAWRDRLARAGALPARARAASPGLADAVIRALPPGGPFAVHVMRLDMAPLGAAVAERLGAAWATLDLDEDDAAMSRSAGDLEQAEAYERALAVFGPLFDGLSAASAGEARSLAERHGLIVEHVPNAVRLPPSPSRRGGREVASLLFVGNLTYAPNAEAAEVLVRDVLPRVLRGRRGRVRAVIAGPHGGALDHLRGEDVDLTGFVPELDGVYAAADVVVAPIRRGAGTRIKLLEAFAHRVPVVASTVAAAGLEVADGKQLLLADDATRVASAVHAVLDDPGLASRLAREAAALVRERHSLEAVTPTIRSFFARAAVAAARGRQAGSR